MEFKLLSLVEQELEGKKSKKNKRQPMFRCINDN
jgi:hypothetical protein